MSSSNVSSVEVRRLKIYSLKKKLIKLELEDLGADNDRDYDDDGSSVEKLLVKMEPEDLGAGVK